MAYHHVIQLNGGRYGEVGAMWGQNSESVVADVDALGVHPCRIHRGEPDLREGDLGVAAVGESESARPGLGTVSYTHLTLPTKRIV